MSIGPLLDDAQLRLEQVTAAEARIDAHKRLIQKEIEFLGDLKLLNNHRETSLSRIDDPVPPGEGNDPRYQLAGSVTGIYTVMLNQIAVVGRVPSADLENGITPETAPILLAPAASAAWLEIHRQLSSGYWTNYAQVTAQPAVEKIDAALAACFEFAKTCAQPRTSSAARPGLDHQLLATLPRTADCRDAADSDGFCAPI